MDPRRGILGFVMALGLVAMGPPAAAQSRQAEPSIAKLAEPEREGQSGSFAEAKAAQARAAQLFHDNRFVEAAELLQFAYRYDPRPVLLFNAGQSYRKAERAQEAMSMYERFLAAAPDHPLAAETRGYLKDMEALLAMQQRAKEVALALEEQLAAKQASDSQAAFALEAERQRNLQIKQTLLQTQTQLESDRKKLLSRRRWILGLSIGLPTAVAAVVGIAAGVYVRSRVSTDGGTALIQN